MTPGLRSRPGSPVGSTRLTVSYPTANGGSDGLVRPSDELATADPPPAAATSTITISTSAALPRSVVVNGGFMALIWRRVRRAPVRLFICASPVLGVLPVGSRSSVRRPRTSVPSGPTVQASALVLVSADSQLALPRAPCRIVNPSPHVVCIARHSRGVASDTPMSELRTHRLEEVQLRT